MCHCDKYFLLTNSENQIIIVKMIQLMPILRRTQYRSIIIFQNCNFVTTKNQVKPREPIQMSYASYENTETHTGSEPSPLVIMHGMFGSKANWNTLSNEFLKNTIPQRKIIAVDARNHGDSPHSRHHSYIDMSDDIKTFLTMLKIKKTALLGHSMGGRACMTFTLQYPDLVDKLIVVDVSPFSNGDFMKSIPTMMASMLKITLSKNVTLSTAKMSADMQLSRMITDKDIRNFLLTNLVQKNDGRYAWRINIPSLLHNYSRHILKFPQITNTFEGPVLFIAGGLSDCILTSDHSPILKLFPNAEFKVIDGAGHLPHSDKPREFLAMALEFLNSKPQTV